MSLSFEARLAVRDFWRSVRNRNGVTRAYQEARQLVEEELFNPNLQNAKGDGEMFDNNLNVNGTGLDVQTKVCNRCKQKKPVDQFIGRGGKPAKSCDDCREELARQRAARKAKADKAPAQVKEPEKAEPQFIGLYPTQAERLLSRAIGGPVKIQIQEDVEVLVHVDVATLARHIPDSGELLELLRVE